jgi:hypothetical protein
LGVRFHLHFNERSNVMFTIPMRRPLALTGAVLAAALTTGYGVEAAAQDAVSRAVVDAHEQARHLLLASVDVPGTATLLPAPPIARSARWDAQEQARRLLTGADIKAAEAVRPEGVTVVSRSVTADAHGLAERLLAGPVSD